MADTVYRKKTIVKDIHGEVYKKCYIYTKIRYAVHQHSSIINIESIIFFWGGGAILVLLNLEVWPVLNMYVPVLLKQFVTTTPDKPLKRISRNFVGI